MNDIAKLLMPVVAGVAPFPPDSRHHGAALLRATLPDGREVRYVARRFTPAPETIEVFGLHVVQAGDRLDLLGATHFGNPTQGWKICDANGLRDPGDALTEPGARLAVGQAVTIRGQSFD